jgi:hypothetical protein
MNKCEEVDSWASMLWTPDAAGVTALAAKIEVFLQANFAVPKEAIQTISDALFLLNVLHHTTDTVTVCYFYHMELLGSLF